MSVYFDNIGLVQQLIEKLRLSLWEAKNARPGAEAKTSAEVHVLFQNTCGVSTIHGLVFQAQATHLLNGESNTFMLHACVSWKHVHTGLDRASIANDSVISTNVLLGAST